MADASIVALPSDRTIADLGIGVVRRASLYALLVLVAFGQWMSVVELVGFPTASPTVVLAFEGVLVAGAVVLAVRHDRQKRLPDEIRVGAAIGVAMWILWGTLYFGAARWTVVATAHEFDDPILARLPLVPAFAPIYLGVHTFSVIPYCAIAERRRLLRYFVGNVLIVALSAVVWVTFPIRMPRPDLIAGSSFGAWLLTLVYAGDPVTNCFPSAHCSVAVYGAFGLASTSRSLFAWGVASAILICVSTVLTKQHYVADVVSGAALAAAMAFVCRLPRPSNRG